MQVVVRALNVLSALAARTKGAGLQELHEEVDIPLGSLHRLVTVLMEEGFVTRSPTNKRYFLGPSARSLAEPPNQRSSALSTPHPAISDAGQNSGETVFLTELIGDRAMCVSLTEGTHPLRLFVRIGQEMPLHAAASGRCLLAYLPEATALHLLNNRSLKPFTPGTPVSVAQVMDRLPLIRARGYDISEDELDRDVWAVAAPVFTSTGAVAASVTLAAAAGRTQDSASRTTATQNVLAAARELSAELGFEARPGMSAADSSSDESARTAPNPPRKERQQLK